MDFKFRITNITGPGIDADELVQDLEGCLCENECSSSSGCSCLQYSKGDSYDEAGRLLHSPESIIPLFECNDNCACQTFKKPCRNRVVGLGVQLDLEVVVTPEKGFGLTSKNPIKSGQFVIEYVGEVISRDEAIRRSKAKLPEEHNYIFTVDECIKGKMETTYIDARYKANLARFLNHSCEPNLFPQIVRIGSLSPRLALYARKDIAVGEELSYSYGNVNSTQTTLGKKCLCNAPSCNRILPSNDF
ncbi:SET domain-containing protein [Ditylenchus destructor]|uniref:SET domain-containing protein n=1 Tax=Ditylenchus destructor TaxID=166010 RepID=A0AAD4NJL7_9BILA|nr:SET domain-containing protein [Ditylenchus destructor]